VEVANLYGFSVKNLAATSQDLTEDIQNMMSKYKKISPDEKPDDPKGWLAIPEISNLHEKFSKELDALENCFLVGGNNKAAELNKFLLMIILSFIVTRSFELGSDQGNFWNKEEPLLSFVTLRDIYNFLHETFGLVTPNDTDREGGNDIRFHANRLHTAAKDNKGYIKKLVTQTFVKHRYLKFNTCENTRDAMLYDEDSEEGKIQVMWDIRAIHEFKIEDLLDGFSFMIVQEPFPSWRRDKKFLMGVGAFAKECEKVCGIHADDYIESSCKGFAVNIRQATP